MDSGQGRGIGPKAFIVGTLGILLACWMSIAIYIPFHFGEYSGDFFPFGASIAFLAILFGLNPLLRLFKADLNRVDLMLVFTMIFVACPLSNSGFSASFLTNLLSPLFFADPTNAWYPKLGQYLPQWLYPHDTRLIAWFWEGLPPGESIPWGGWIGPLVPWAAIFASGYTIMVTMTAIMRKQWVENERLIFPLMEVPMALLEDREKGRIIPPVMRKRIFWIGAAIPVVVFGTQLLNGFNPNFPALRVFGSQVLVIRVTETWRELHVNLIPAIVAFAYFAKLDVLFSLWFFAVFAFVEENIMKMVGYSAGPMIHYEQMQHPALAWQGLGGMVVFALVGLFMARRHLKGVVRKIVFNDPGVDDSGEPMSYRSAGILFALSVATLLIFLHKMGMTISVAATMIFFLLISYLAITRVVIEGGLVLFTIPVNPVGAVIGLFGAKAMGATCMGAVAACAPFINNFKQIVIPTIANSMKLVEEEKLQRGALVKACAWALAFGTVFCLWYYLVRCYDVGANSSPGFNLKFAGDRYFRSLVHTVKTIADPDSTRMIWAGVGAAVMAVLTVGRYNFAWWPLHPIGYPFGFSGGVQTAMFSLFLAWAAKSIILRIGGVPLYLKLKPFFIGILIGHIIAVAAHFVCNMLMGAPGNPADFVLNFG